MFASVEPLQTNFTLDGLSKLLMPAGSTFFPHVYVVQDMWTPSPQDGHRQIRDLLRSYKDAFEAGRSRMQITVLKPPRELTRGMLGMSSPWYSTQSVLRGTWWWAMNEVWHLNPSVDQICYWGGDVYPHPELLRVLQRARSRLAHPERPSKCRECRTGGAADGGLPVDPSYGCTHFCSGAGYCGEGLAYKGWFNCRLPTFGDPFWSFSIQGPALTPSSFSWDEWALLLRHHLHFCLGQGGHRLAWDVALLRVLQEGPLPSARLVVREKEVLGYRYTAKADGVSANLLADMRSSIDSYIARTKTHGLDSLEWDEIFTFDTPVYVEPGEFGITVDLNSFPNRGFDDDSQPIPNKGPDRIETELMMRQCFEIGIAAKERCGSHCGGGELSS